MKTYVITLSKVFPKAHSRAGQETGFRSKFLKAINIEDVNSEDMFFFNKNNVYKLHTIRRNYELWAKRFREISEGRAILSVRQWTGKPYQSKQTIIAELGKNEGIGIERLDFPLHRLTSPAINFNPYLSTDWEMAHNDGLDYDDWLNWFKGYDLTKTMVIIHFTKFRYGRLEHLRDNICGIPNQSIFSEG